MGQFLRFCSFLILSLAASAIGVRAGVPVVTAPPVGTTVCSGSNAVFYVSTADTPAATGFLWKVSMDGGMTWDTVANGTVYSGATTDTLTVLAAVSRNGYRFRCVAYDTAGISIDSTYAVLTVDTAIHAAAISGHASVCMGTNDTLTDATTGGIWKTANVAIDTITSTGIVTPVAAGTDTVFYIVSNSCNSDTARFYVTINGMPVVSAIHGAWSLCYNATTVLTDSTPGGTWSNVFASIDTVNAMGKVFGIRKGIDTIKYKVTNACGSTTVSHMISVDSILNAGTITGAHEICFNSIDTLRDTMAGGVWSHSVMALDSISASGVLYGVAPGTDTVKYSMTNGCGVVAASFILKLDNIAIPGPISGSSHLCYGSTIYLYESSTGGTWGHTNAWVDTIYGGSLLAVHGRHPGMDSISYSDSNACGVHSAWKVITIDTIWVGAISGGSSICVGTTDTLTEAATGGVWTSGNPAIATVLSTPGVVAGLSAGYVPISYTVTNSCGSLSAHWFVSVNPLPFSGAISGVAHLCIGSTASLTDTASGGTWSSSVAMDSVSTAGVFHAVVAGTAHVTYTVGNSCGTSSSSFTITVDSTAVVSSISGPSRVCENAVAVLSNSYSGGVWSSLHSSVATVNSLTGHVTGVTPGTDSIKYLLVNTCGADSTYTVITVDTLPNAGMISGGSAVCLGDALTLTDTVTVGTWSVSDTIRGTFMAGVFSSMAAGIDTVMYSVSNAHCTAMAWNIVRIDTAPVAAPITGATSVCIGSHIFLYNANVAGTYSWVSSNSDATVSTSGVVVGVSAGMDTISYNFSNSCGSVVATKVINVQSAITGSAITAGATAICSGNTVSLSTSNPGGFWMSGNPLVASIDSPTLTVGVFTGRTPGTAVISYSFWNACGAAVDTISIRVDGTASMITGIDSVGAGLTRMLMDSVSGGIWTSYDNSIATVDSTGLVMGINNGIDTIVYALSNTCGNSSAMVLMHVGSSPSAGAIITTDTFVCAGYSLYLNDTAVLGGVWSAVNGNATVDAASGLVTGIVPYTYDTILYTFTNGFGSSTVKKKLYINSVPRISVHQFLLTGPGSYPLVDTPANGTWWSSDPASITFTTGDLIFLQTPDSAHNYRDTLVYTVTNSCGTSRDTIYYNFATGIVNTNEVPTMIKVFPNPGSGDFKIAITSSREETAEVVISNMVGQKVDEFQAVANQVTSFRIDLPAGVYMLTAITPTKRYEIRLVVAK
jgi:Secretion system C-terminal sorting domain